MTEKCPICTMTFEIEDVRSNTERLRCSECSRPFWCSGAKPKPIRIGMTPEQFAGWQEIQAERAR